MSGIQLQLQVNSSCTKFIVHCFPFSRKYPFTFSFKLKKEVGHECSRLGISLNFHWIFCILKVLSASNSTVQERVPFCQTFSRKDCVQWRDTFSSEKLKPNSFAAHLLTRLWTNTKAHSEYRFSLPQGLCVLPQYPWYWLLLSLTQVSFFLPVSYLALLVTRISWNLSELIGKKELLLTKT